MIAKNGNNFDIILVTGEYYDDHPLSPVGVIARILDAKGFSVGIIEKPIAKDDFTQLGEPNLCFGVTSGSLDSMLNNYTPMKHSRITDQHSSVSQMPDRAVIVYCNALKRYWKTVPIVIGGIESSLRRFAHYDYWDNAIRKSILFDSRASILVYGNGEKQIIEIAERLQQKKDLNGIEGTCVIRRDIDSSFDVLPSFHEVCKDPKQFCVMQQMFSNDKNLAQEYDNNYLVQYKYPTYTPEFLDWIYSLPYSRKLHPRSLLFMAKFSVVTHRGCLGDCNFCSLSLHQGERIISRSEESILDEIKNLTHHPGFKGYIDDLGGPSANMYGMDCIAPTSCASRAKSSKKKESVYKNCLVCQSADKSHRRLLMLLRKARKIPGVKKIFIRSGIRYDLALQSPEYIREISEYHLSGCLKIAPEHFSQKVLMLMNKDNKRFEEFVDFFTRLNVKKKQSLRYYFMIGHPGDTLSEVLQLKQIIRKYGLTNIEHFQLFTPTPMTVSSCMYWTGLNPFTMEIVPVVWDYHTKKKLKRILLEDHELQGKHRQTCDKRDRCDE
ncbi:MAG: YgiQ family radical SAM protein [Euryarchaeota archaeon]|nr:YgiQ family radical SAM protein [Euryarchaeota archaeon]